MTIVRLLLISWLRRTERLSLDASAKSPPRAAKLRKILGDDAPQAYIDKVNADFKKWYLRSDHAPEDLQTDPEGTVKGGTIQALVERLTTHDAPGQFPPSTFPVYTPTDNLFTDTKYNKTFLMTYKSFTTTNELFDLLVARFWTQPPEGITPAELDEWKRLRQHVVRARLVLLLSPPLICTKRWHQSSEHLQVDDRRQRHSRGRRLLHP